MNRYPLWKYATIVVALIISIFYTLPNFFGEAPAVQISAAKSSVEIDVALQNRVEQILSSNQVQYDQVNLKPEEYILIRFANPQEQMRAKDLISNALIPNQNNAAYTIALNLVPRSPTFFNKFNARPMYLGLDLRGGVHFMLQLDLDAILQKRVEGLANNLRSQMRENDIRNNSFTQKIIGNSFDKQHVINIVFPTNQMLNKTNDLLTKNFADLITLPNTEANQLTLTLTPNAEQEAKESALKQNISTLRNRINELGVAEPVIQQQGLDRIIVQLPGVQDTAQAKSILGRTATLELRMVDESPAGREAEHNKSASVPFGSERFFNKHGQAVIVKTQAVLTGENLQTAQAGFDQQSHEPIVSLSLDGAGAAIFREISRKNIGNRMAIILFEKGQGEVVTAPVIRSEIPNGQVQISGSMTIKEAQTVSLLLRAGALAAPMEIIEERIIGPSLGAENIKKGINSVTYGFLAIVIFLIIYYHLMGLFSSIALGFNLLMIMAVMSMLQATLTLPGIAALALSLGMAIDSNVLINERIRDELRTGMRPQMAINTGFERAWATILDANVTTLIAAIALLAFGSGPIRGFAIVHALGVMTSMFTSVFFMRGLVNLWYGKQKNLSSISIGQIWQPSQTNKED